MAGLRGGKMVSTQIQLTDRQAFLLKQEALRQGVSVAELIRRGVNRILDQEKPFDREALRKRALTLSGYHSGLSDLSTNHDRYLAEEHTPTSEEQRS